MREVVGIARRRGIEVGELGRVHLAEDDGALRLEREDDLGVVAGGRRGGPRAAVGSRRQALDVDDVLDGDRHAVQRPADAALGRLRLALGGNGKGALAVHLAPALHVRIGFPDAIEIAARERDRRERPAGDGGRQLAHPPRIGDVARLRCGHCFPSSLAQPPAAPWPLM
jgi:hypothetical protein